ncbi:hypothetical protein RFI_33880 [Reticulomyxa filosa]|uniref:Uncharacterized protein n=1 Tax=Reticulomyxa filosa TaxID=46433 RepID=X6LRZ5_RETFI|nr:hypothetical protein RFI_33880 [Reticulomyxa filosa]|eukprot:ETO03525.1 hypothetical protein RFI_33880 [Reticulomyxa filosa]
MVRQTCQLLSSSKELKSVKAVIKLLGLKNKNVLSRKVLAHTFSGNFRTLFVHFAVDVNDQQLSQLAHNFNDPKKCAKLNKKITVTITKELQSGQDVIFIVRHLLLNKRIFFLAWKNVIVELTKRQNIVKQVPHSNLNTALNNTIRYKKVTNK